MRKVYGIILSVLMVFGIVALFMNAAGISMNVYLESVGYQGIKTSAVSDSIKVTIPPMTGLRPIILGGSILVGSTAHKTWFLTPNKQTTVKTAMAALSETLYTKDTCYDAGGNAPAAGDIFVIEQTNGQYATVTCSTATDRLKIFFKKSEANSLGAVASGKKVWGLGAPGDANGQAYQLTVSTVNNYPADAIIGSVGGPIVYRSGCVTKIDTLGYLSWGYINK